MTYQGRFHNGVVVLEGGAALPEGTPVTVSVEQARKTPAPAQLDLISEEEQRRVVGIIDRIAALPIEGFMSRLAERITTKFFTESRINALC